MDLNLTTAAVLFPAISLILLAYTNRFLALAALIRSLHDRYSAQPHPLLIAQIGNLRYRVLLIRNMQALGVLSLLFCVVCLILIFFGLTLAAKAIFIISLLLMAASLTLSIWEIQISVRALNFQLRDLEEQEKQKK